MQITIEPLEKKLILKEMSIQDIDNIVNALSDMKKEILNNIEILENVDANHVPTEAQLSGAVGYHPDEEWVSVKKEIICKSTWGDKTIELISSSARNELSIKKHGSISLLALNEVNDEHKKEEEYLKSNDAPDELEIKTKTIQQHMKNEYTVKSVPNMVKAEHQITQMYLNNELIGAKMKWQPCGGTYVAKAVNCFFLVEVNINGLEIKKISESFYDSFVKEFSMKKKA